MKKIMPVLIGLIFAGIGIFILVKGNEKIKRCTEEVVGTVVEVDVDWSTDSDGENKYIYFPIVKYSAGNKTITKKK